MSDLDDLLIETATIKDFSEVNSKGSVDRTESDLHADIPTRLNDLSYSDRKFFENRPEYSNVVKKAFIQGKFTGITVGMIFSHSSGDYRIVEVKTRKDSEEIHHFELFLETLESKL